MSGPRILLGKPGLDRHDRALNVIAFALREAGVPALPLRGVPVADLTRFVAGSQATMWLTALGAEVVKVEPPSGDPYRTQGTERTGGESVLFMALNAGKRSFAVDFRTPARLADLRYAPADISPPEHDSVVVAA